MIKNIRVENFLCFKNLSLNLRGANDEPLPYVLIYGENGSGKTNLMLTQRFLRASLETRTSVWVGDKHIGKGTVEVPEGFTMKSLYSEYSRIGSNGPMVIEFTFWIGGRDAVYKMRIDRSGLLEEQLIYVLNGRKAELLHISPSETRINNILSTQLKNEVGTEIRKYWGLHSALSIIYHGYRSYTDSYIDQNFATELRDVLSEIMGIGAYFSDDRRISPNPLDNPKSGQISVEMEPVMDALEEAMRAFFCGLYSDIEDVRYVKQRRQRFVDYELVFDKRVEGEVITIPYYKESAGTQKLMDEFIQIMSCVHGSTVLIDEMDSGIHDLLMSGIFGKIKDSMRGQLIATTHNTLLMQKSDPKCTFIIILDAEGCREARSIKSITTTQKCNNNTKRYLEGDFGGIPIMGYVDLADISDRLFDGIGW